MTIVFICSIYNYTSTYVCTYNHIKYILSHRIRFQRCEKKRNNLFDATYCIDKNKENLMKPYMMR